MTLKFQEHLPKHERNGEAGMHRTIVSGGFWFPMRRAACYGESSACAMCGELECDDFHAYWACSALFAENGPLEVKRSNFFCKMAKDKCALAPCFWLRSLTPLNWTKPPEQQQQEADDECITQVGVFPEGGGPGIYAPDGSGGRFSADPRRRG